MKKLLVLGSAILIFTGLFMSACTGASKRVTVLEGTFYTLQEAYDSGFITRNDIKHISYFATGRVIEVLDAYRNRWEMELSLPDDYWTKIRRIDFMPQNDIPSLAKISPQVIAGMKSAFYTAHRELMDISLQQEISIGSIPQGTTALDTISILDFLGTYNGFYAVRITSSLWLYGGFAIHQLVSNIGWGFGGAPFISIFRITETFERIQSGLF